MSNIAEQRNLSVARGVQVRMQYGIYCQEGPTVNSATQRFW